MPWLRILLGQYLFQASYAFCQILDCFRECHRYADRFFRRLIAHRKSFCAIDEDTHLFCTNGFLISQNAELLRNISIAKEASDLHTNIFTQYVIWDYLMHNDYETHISKIKELYQKQAQAMMDAMEKYFPSTVKYTRPQGGMFLWVTLPKGVSAMDLFPKALEKKVAFVPGDPFYINVKNVNTMRLNYTNADCETIEEGIRRLGELLESIV